MSKGDKETYKRIICSKLAPEDITKEIDLLNKLSEDEYVRVSSELLGLNRESKSRSYFLKTQYGLMPLKIIVRTAYSKKAKGENHNYNSITYASVVKELGFEFEYMPRVRKKAGPTNETRKRRKQYYTRLASKRHHAFRKQVLKNQKGRCAFTGCAVFEALEAAHILPVAHEGSDHVSNGILLRRDVHRLFDLNLIKVCVKTGAISLDSSIDKTYRDEIKHSFDFDGVDLNMFVARDNVLSK